MGRRSKILRAFLGVFVLFAAFWFVFVGVTGRNASKSMTIRVESTETLKHWKWIGLKRRALKRDSNIIYVSKRRVPSGPDPIHNRRAFKTRQPPGRT
ncbi:hypothetical protein UlMin_014881 [Ulmus minor]